MSEEMAQARRTCTFASLMGSCYLHQLDPEGYIRDLLRVLPLWPKNRMLELSPKFWRATRALLDDAQMALPLGPLTVPPARLLRETAITEVTV
jgi:transposase